ncbi:MAG: hypothetical protein EAZ47_08645 [Bacteroidetes bacterium]|nr:MAG: hypothetical protein EAY72_07360 [Bacteroidota bacterium]TAE67750.1 MAG: hypothetical protein EAY68_05060 [Bacteroidota bacterium]TAF92545.1 MAG: hypothetical protein EAZ47_08645 [Bacteroidota bacterium]
MALQFSKGAALAVINTFMLAPLVISPFYSLALTKPSLVFIGICFLAVLILMVFGKSYFLAKAIDYKLSFVGITGCVFLWGLVASVKVVLYFGC